MKPSGLVWKQLTVRCHGSVPTTSSALSGKSPQAVSLSKRGTRCQPGSKRGTRNIRKVNVMALKKGLHLVVPRCHLQALLIRCRHLGASIPEDFDPGSSESEDDDDSVHSDNEGSARSVESVDHDSDEYLGNRPPKSWRRSRKRLNDVLYVSYRIHSHIHPCLHWLLQSVP